MQHYNDRNGDSNVSAYEIGPGWIHVQFKGGSVYEWTESSCGAAAIATMHQLATSGDGLNRFINLNVKKGYTRKIR